MCTFICTVKRNTQRKVIWIHISIYLSLILATSFISLSSFLCSPPSSTLPSVTPLPLHLLSSVTPSLPSVTPPPFPLSLPPPLFPQQTNDSPHYLQTGPSAGNQQTAPLIVCDSLVCAWVCTCAGERMWLCEITWLNLSNYCLNVTALFMRVELHHTYEHTFRIKYVFIHNY